MISSDSLHSLQFGWIVFLSNFVIVLWSMLVPVTSLHFMTCYLFRTHFQMLCDYWPYLFWREKCFSVDFVLHYFVQIEKPVFIHWCFQYFFLHIFFHNIFCFWQLIFCKILFIRQIKDLSKLVLVFNFHSNTFESSWREIERNKASNVLSRTGTMDSVPIRIYTAADTVLSGKYWNCLNIFLCNFSSSEISFFVHIWTWSQ